LSSYEQDELSIVARGSPGLRRQFPRISRYNIDVNDARRTLHFLTVSLLVRDQIGGARRGTAFRTSSRNSGRTSRRSCTDS